MGCFLSQAGAQDDPRRFAYNGSSPLGPEVLSMETRKGVEVYDLRYAGSEGRVPA